jgi:hypothetical protein
MAMSTKKIASTEKLRTAALAEIGARLSRMEVRVAPKEEAAAVVAAGSPVPPKARAKAAKKGSKGAKPAKAAKPEARPRPEPKSRKDRTKMSGLDAAAKVLAEAKKPMNCKEIAAEVFKRNLWTSEGATPEATINAAIIREIAAKGGDSRFVRKDRGLFAAAKAG